MPQYTYLRYTGTVLGSHAYPAPGYRRIAFGQNPTHFQQLVTVEAAAFLKQQHGKELLEIPMDMGRSEMVLHTLINASSLLTDAEKSALASGYQTLGEVIADQENIYAMLGDYDAPKLLNKIRGHFGLPLLPEPAPVAVAYEPAPEEIAVEEPPKKRGKKD